MPTLRTIEKAFAAIKENDPETSLTLTAFRRMVNNGEIASFPIGTKKLVNLDAVLKSLDDMCSFKTAS